jgi:hypothetical protein
VKLFTNKINRKKKDKLIFQLLLLDYSFLFQFIGDFMLKITVSGILGSLTLKEISFD